MPTTLVLDESLRAAIVRATEQSALPARRAPITRTARQPVLPSVPLRQRHAPLSLVVPRSRAVPVHRRGLQLSLFSVPSSLTR
ncbi:MAG: hypothetical protein V4739_11315 [Pseudomonadota bacterium]